MKYVSLNEVLLVAVSVMILGIMGCSQGPAEEAGEDLDEAVEDVRDAVDDTCDRATDSNCQ